MNIAISNWLLIFHIVYTTLLVIVSLHFTSYLLIHFRIYLSYLAGSTPFIVQSLSNLAICLLKLAFTYLYL